MAGSKNCAANRGSSMVIHCPDCDGKLSVVLVKGHTDKTGKYLTCSKCEYRAKYKKGDYVEYVHTFVKGK